MSFRFDRNKPEDFGLRSSDNSGIYIRQSDGSSWIQKDLYDFGWGNEYGFVRLPELDFAQLWHLITRSKIPDNRYGAAFELETRYPGELLNLLWDVFYHKRRVPHSLLQTLEILDLNKLGDVNNMMGRNVNEFECGYQKQQFVNLKIELIKNSRSHDPPNRNVILVCGVLLLLIFIITYAGHLFLQELARQEKIRTVLQLGRLAPLPKTVLGLQAEETEHGVSDYILLKFAAPHNEIVQFLKDSKGLDGIRSKSFHYSEWYKAHIWMTQQDAWFDPTTQKGRVFDISPGKNAVASRVIVDDAGSVIYIEVFRP